MISIETLRQFKIGGYAVFDLSVSFLGMYLLSPSLSKIFKKLKIDVPKQNWIILTLPVGIFFHLLVGRITPMTKDFFSIRDHYFLKLLIVISLILGAKGVKIVKK